jgi:PBS lyase HEAT-like repeat
MTHVLRQVIYLSSSIILLACVIMPLAAQAPLQPKDGEETFLGGLQDKLDLKTEKKKFDELTTGKASLVGDKEAKDVLAKAARWYVFRLTNPKYHGGEAADEKASINDLVKDAQAQLLLPRGKKEINDSQKEYIKEFSKELIKCLREVLSRNSKPIVRVNAARMLASIGEAGQEEVADTLADIIQNPRESDAVKLWAFRGLHELFEGTKAQDPIFKDAKRQTRALMAVADYISRKPEPMPTEADQVEALRFVRREAVRALGQSRDPIVPKADKPEGRTAWLLLRVARKDGLTPEPGIAEQVEGAVGACRLRASKDVQLDYVAHNVGATAVDFVNQASRAKAGTADAGIPWKLYAARLHQALEDLRAHTKEGQAPGVAEYVDKLVRQAQDPLRAVWDGKDANPTPLDTWLRENPPKSTTVYKSIADSTIGAPGAGGK